MRHLRRRRPAKNARDEAQGTTPLSTPTAAMRAGVSCIAANATAIYMHATPMREW